MSGGGMAAGLQLLGLLVTLPGLWLAVHGVRVVVSGRIDERRRAVSSLKWGIPLLAIGLALLFGGAWLARA